MKRIYFLGLVLIVVGLLQAGLVQAQAAGNETSDASTAAVTPAASAEATAVVKGFYATLVDTMKQGDQLGFNGRYKKLDPVITAAFNLPLMTRLAVGPVWANASPDEQKQLTSAFSDFSVATYANQFKAYNGEQFNVTGSQAAEGGGVIVQTTIVPKGHDPVALNYLMRQDDHGKWRVVDIFLDGSISEMAARRSEFSSVAKRDGIPGLVNSLGEKSKELGPS